MLFLTKESMVIDLLIMPQATGMIGRRLCFQLAEGNFGKRGLETLKILSGYRSTGADQYKPGNKERKRLKYLFLKREKLKSV